MKLDACKTCVEDVRVVVECKLLPEPPEDQTPSPHGTEIPSGPQTAATILDKMRPFLDVVGDVQRSDIGAAIYARENPVRVAIIDSGVFYSTLR